MRKLIITTFLLLLALAVSAQSLAMMTSPWPAEQRTEYTRVH